MTAAARSRRILAAGAALALALAAPAAADDLKVVADGLDNPRGLAFGPGNDLYVAESGRGGSGPCITGEGGDVCFGTTGAVTRIDIDDDGDQRRIATGLPSVAERSGAGATGPSDVSFPRQHDDNGDDGWDSRGFLTVGLGGNPALRSTFGDAGAGLGWLHRLWPDGRTRQLADIAGFEASDNPAGGDVDSNPNSVAAKNGREAVVADAGGNYVASADRLGAIALLGVIPGGTAPAPAIPEPEAPPPGTPIDFESVPTSVVLGKDGAIYVGLLTGFPFPKDGASVWVIEPGEDPRQFATGFTTILDLAFGKDGSLYVLQIATDSLVAGPSPGALIRVKPDGSREELAAGKLTEPTGLVLHGRYAYVSNHGTEAGTGEVVRIALPDGAEDEDDDNGDD
jgi:hypothetical protein